MQRLMLDGLDLYSLRRVLHLPLIIPIQVEHDAVAMERVEGTTARRIVRAEPRDTGEILVAVQQKRIVDPAGCVAEVWEWA